jgi:hypothetical protein
MYSAIELPLGWEQAKGSPAGPCDARRLLPAWARQRAGDHCGLKIVDPAWPPVQPHHTAEARIVGATAMNYHQQAERPG